MVESALLLDAAMDLCMLALLQRCFGRTHIPRLICAYALLAICTYPALQAGLTIFLFAPAMILGAATATGERRPARILEAAICLMCAYAVCAGFCMLAGGATIAGGACGAALMLFLLRRHRHLHYKWNIEVFAQKRDVCAAFPALIDTGNRLREHKSALPVLILEAGAAPALAALIERLPQDELRFLPYGVLGASGELCCFRPDRLQMCVRGAGICNAPDCWIAIFPGRIPGNARALAPPEFAQVAENTGFYLYTFPERARRFCNGIFKHKAIHLRSGCTNPKGLRVLHRRQRSASASADP